MECECHNCFGTGGWFCVDEKSKCDECYVSLDNFEVEHTYETGCELICKVCKGTGRVKEDV